MPLIFNAAHLQETRDEYVCWIDIMGIQSMMSRSLKITANFMCKVHVAALTHLKDDIKIYPIMDGFYASSPNQNSIIGFIKDVFRELANEFINQKNIYYRFIIKGALAFGPVLHGEEIPRQASYDLDKNENYKKSLLIGLPMVQACQSETNAPPFGIYVHESARSFSPPGCQPVHHVWMRWFNDENRENYLNGIKEYFEWCKKRPNCLEYSEDRIEEHLKRAIEYFQPE